MGNPQIGPISGTTTPGQSGPGSDDNKGVLHIPQSSSITGTSPSDCLVSYSRHSLGGGVLPLCRGAVSIFYSPSRLGKHLCWGSFSNHSNNQYNRDNYEMLIKTFHSSLNRSINIIRDNVTTGTNRFTGHLVTTKNPILHIFFYYKDH